MCDIFESFSFSGDMFLSFSTEIAALASIFGPDSAGSDPETPSGEEPRIYVVQRGDTLWGIARQHYGKGSLYPKIHEANSQIANPDRIFPGQILTIPA